MNDDPVRRGLTWGVLATLLLPMILVVALGTGGFLTAVGDDAAAAVCRWVAVPLGGLWLVAVAATTALSAAAHLTGRGRPPLRRRRPGRRAPDRDDVS